ncbi:OprD family outer membrane porin [Acinetobacter gerneri]|uniref:OprD family outer membrane porin n=1 Tax=Acinetobacter gerneri TaxID=202952 RepID=A0AAW8JKH1_9GAMM|nr:OprD family outer membrane porin [Acinetobacter gerneri]MDQ9010403.1 OprD family outer membrane porin [Acinetobacter gerneri]MDQ9014602.1 OprD family outer membrane porin [Acinetobacter gerneri]MDQ9025773.1 OprD family outer membrane porin [Acinetobacter gerneri]MDQ9053054.1 OprD family outer membrane porin [Acinetobacter gerneri]MDQ9060672.1 OprD family outer membrane porin [Acinetobacter gerneri]
MLKAQQLTLAVLIQAALVSTAFASEQSESKGFVEDAEGTVLFRTGYINRDKKNVKPGVDNSSFAQTAMVKLESGYTQGIVGFGAGIIGDGSFKIGENKHAGNNMIPRETAIVDGVPTKGAGDAYDHWSRGGGFVKARFSNTSAVYGTQILDIPVLASNTTRLVPEYFTGTLLTSHEIKNLEVIAGKFTKNQYSDQIATDSNHLRNAWVWGAKYKFDENLTGSYYGTDVKDKLDRHYVNANYKLPLANKDSLTFDFSGYHTEWDKGASASSSSLGSDSSDRSNNIWALSSTYNTGPHSVMLAYQQNTGNTGYAYGENADGGQSIYLPNSYLSDFNGRKEKSAQLQYNLDFGAYGIPGLNWTSAFVYGWNIQTKTENNAKEREFFNQVKYTVQSGFAKDTSLRVRYSHYRNDASYANDYYMPDTNEWRLFFDIPVKLF